MVLKLNIPAVQCSTLKKNSWVKTNNALRKNTRDKSVQPGRFPDSQLPLLYPALSLCGLDLLGGVNDWARRSSLHNSCKAWVGLLTVNACSCCSWLTRRGCAPGGGGGRHLGAKEGGACGSCKRPTGTHYTWVLSSSFRAPKNFLPLNGAFGKREVHWNHKQTQEESENQKMGRG